MRRPAHRLPLTVVAAAATASVLFVASPAIAGADRIRAEGELTRYTSAVPEDARARVQAVYTAAGDSIVTLHVWGMAPNTPYGAHGHVNPCGETGADAGPHFQNVLDPVTLLDPPKPSVNPVYANPVNEIWLDLTTDADGDGVAQTKVPWQFSPTRRAESVIIHVEHTHTGPSDSGVAGARLACLTVGF
jgi:Cu-Zn family superoxide dismutase